MKRYLADARVYSSDGKHFGYVNDVLFDHQGKFETVLIGVGGFLGFGERTIGISASELTITRDEKEHIRVSGKFIADNVSNLPTWNDPSAQAAR